MLLAAVLATLAACGASDGAAGTLDAGGGSAQTQDAATAAEDTTTSGTDASTAATPPDTGAGDATRPSDGGSSKGDSAVEASSSGGTLSGLAWKSGAATSDDSVFATWRGRPLDVGVNWDNRATWAEIEDADIYGAIKAFNGFAGVLELGTAMVPGNGASLASGVTFAACAAGMYDSHFATLGANLVREGRGDSYIRLGWEANTGVDSVLPARGHGAPIQGAERQDRLEHERRHEDARVRQRNRHLPGRCVR
jgi:hypothetical protein